MALSVFGAPLGDLSQAALSKGGTIFQIGVTPLRIDVITAMVRGVFTSCDDPRFAAGLA
jgi:hypothetical protein